MLTEDPITEATNSDLLELETSYIGSFRLSYNILSEGGNSFGYRHTEEYRRRMRANYSDARRKTIGDLNRGRKLAATTIELIRAAALARPPMSDETREKCKTHRRPITIRLLSDDTLVGVYPDILTGALAIKCNEKTIRRALKSNGIVKGTYMVTDA